MKKLFSISVGRCCVAALALSLSAFALTSQAQTTNAPTTPQDFLTSVQGFLTSFNPALSNTFAAGKKLTLWTGAEQTLGTITSADLGLSYKLPWLNSTNSYLSADAVFKNAGVAGTMVAGQGGVAYSYVYVDTEISGYLHGGYDVLHSQPLAAVGLRVRKALTENTFAQIWMELPIQKHYTGAVSFGVGTGFTF